MRTFAVEGLAGSGKTYRLLKMLSEVLATAPLAVGQRVMALTFMHGARRRLHDRLRGVKGLAARYECATIDSFAVRLLQRWRTLAAAQGFALGAETDFERQCDSAAILLERPEVRAWVAASYPVLLVDEAQDLKPQRLRMVKAMTESITTLIAADEFQCLDRQLRPNPAVEWLHAQCSPEVLRTVYRTNAPALLLGAAAIREGKTLPSGAQLRIHASKGVPMAAAFLANAIAWAKNGTIAIITPSNQGGFAREVIDRVCTKACGKQNNGPYRIRWERADDEEVSALLSGFTVEGHCTSSEAAEALLSLPQAESGPVKQAIRWIQRQVRVLGRAEFSRDEIASVVSRNVTLSRQHQSSYERFAAMTVQQAKNREFDGVIVLWPYQVGGDAEHKRRLLYNAVTRAKAWCTIIAQKETLLKSAPFQ